MATPSIKFRKMFIRLNEFDRSNILRKLQGWINSLRTVETPYHCDNLQNFFNRLEIISGPPGKHLEQEHWIAWIMASPLDNCIAFQEIVKAKLNVPTKSLAVMYNTQPSTQTSSAKPRKTIPKKIKEAIWKRDCGDSIKGTCFCCKTELSVLGEWHAGHIVAHCNGGPDTADNLRVVCLGCNRDMGDENMNDFKKRVYPD